MFKRIAAVLFTSACMMMAPAQSANAQECGGIHVVRTNETLSGLAKSYYGVPRTWRRLYNANLKLVGSDPGLIYPGQRLRIPCRGSAAAKAQKKLANLQDATAQPASVSLPVPSVTFLTAGDYQPFTDQKLPQGGMLTEVVERAMQTQRSEVPGPQSKIVWVNDWAAHLNPLLSNKAFDLGFPWFKPECSRYDELDAPAKFRCDTFHFSSPVFEILVLFFKRKGSDFTFTGDADVIGKRLCRPTGYFTFDLDKDGRNWVRDKKVTMVKPQTVEECFRMLERGEVDAVTLNEFTGKRAVKKLALNDKVEVIERPVSILSLHVIVAKTHKHAKFLLKYVNQGLERIRSNGTYDDIVENHLTRFWKAQGGS